MKKLNIIFAGVFSASGLFLTACSAEAGLPPDDGLTVVEKISDMRKIEEMLETELVVFEEADGFGENENQETGSIYYSGDNSVNKTELVYRYYFKGYKNSIIEGEIYKSAHDTEESIARLKQDIYDDVESGAALIGFGDPFGYTEGDIYRGSFNIGDSYIPVKNSTTIRNTDAVFNNELLGKITDYETVYILNNPSNKEKLWMLITHETYLKPTQTNNRNFKGVGVEFKLDLKEGFMVRDYAPKAQGPSKTVSYSSGFNLSGGIGGGGGSVSAGTNFGFSYTKNVESPRVYDASQIPESVDIRFEYVDPGSWYGDFCAYNSGTTFQCSLAVLEARKTDTFIQYTSEIKGRFQKYQNWTVPWVDEYYSIFVDDTYKISDLLKLMEQVNA